MKINPKSQKGAVTLIVLVTMLFLTAFLMTMYIRLANKAGISAETTAEIAKRYNNIDEANNIYAGYFADENSIIPITNREELEKIGSNEYVTVNEKKYYFSAEGNYVIMNDIDLEGDEKDEETWWNPITTFNEGKDNEYEFTGVLDGLGYTITGLYIDSNENYQGLFSKLYGTVRNLNISESYVNGNEFVGAIAGLNDEDGVIENCTNKATIIGNNYVGGIAGSINGTITDCKNIGNIIGNTNVTGGYFVAVNDNNNTPVEVWSKTRTLSENYKFISGESVATVPKGFKVSANLDEQTIKDGLVIQDSNENEFVWVPVANPTSYIDKITILNNDIQKIVNSGIYPLAISKKNNSNYIGAVYNFSGQQQLTLTSLYIGDANATGYEEPDKLTIGDKTEQFYHNAYNEMVSSVSTYGGFYVGRYEISLDSTGTYAQSKKNQTALVSNNNFFTNKKPWYEMYDLETKYATTASNLGVNSTMIWGSQWDQIMLFVNGKKDGEENDFYITSTGSRKSGNGDTKTGMNIKDKVCNIYDLEAGRQEWTLEQNGWSRRTVRGGNYNIDGTASQRSGTSDNYAQPDNIPNNDYISSRMSLYIKTE